MQDIPHMIRSLLAIGFISLAASVTGCANFEDDDDNNDESSGRFQQDKIGDEDADDDAE